MAGDVTVTAFKVRRGYSFSRVESMFTGSCGFKPSVQKAAGSGLGGFLGCSRFCARALAKFGFGFEHFDLSQAVEVHWFGFVRLGCLCRLWCDGRGGWEALTPGTGFEDVDILDFAAPQLRGISTGSSDLQVDFLNPPRSRGKIGYFLTNQKLSKPSQNEELVLTSS